jgi:hypothetical protein
MGAYVLPVKNGSVVFNYSSRSLFVKDYPEVRRQMAEDRGQKTEVRRQKTEVRWQRTEDKIWKSEVGPGVVR